MAKGFNRGGGMPGNMAQLMKQAAARLIVGDRDLFLQKDISCIQSFIHQHRGDACLLLSVQDRLLDRRCASVLRKQGGMHIHASERRDLQNCLRQDLSESDHDDHVRRDLTDALHQHAAVFEVSGQLAVRDGQGFIGHAKHLACAGGFVCTAGDELFAAHGLMTCAAVRGGKEENLVSLLAEFQREASGQQIAVVRMCADHQKTE